MATVMRHDTGDPAVLRARRDDDRKVAAILLARAPAPREAAVLMERLADAVAADLALGAAPDALGPEHGQAAAHAAAAMLCARYVDAGVAMKQRVYPGGRAGMHAWRWWRAFALVAVSGAADWRGWFARPDVIAACQSPSGDADDFWPMACEAFATAVAGGDPRSNAAAALALLDQAQIATPDFVTSIMRPRLAAIAALGAGVAAAWNEALVAALAAHRDYWGAHPRYETPEGFVACDLGALRAAAWVRGLRDDVASPYLDLPASPACYPAIALAFPTVTVADALEAHWVMDRAGMPRGGRTHRTEWRDDALLAHYSVSQNEAGPAARFSFNIAGAVGSRALLAFDPGQALAISDSLSRRVPDPPPVDVNARRAARAELAEAIAALARVRAAIPDGADRVPDAAFRSAEGKAIREAEPGRFWRDRLDAVDAAWRGLLAEYDAPPEQEIQQALDATSALALAEKLADLARPLLERLRDDPAGFLAAVRPRQGDAALAFVPSVAAAAARAYAASWANRSPPHVDAGQTQLEIVAAPAGMFGSDNVFSAAFPRGYRAVAALFQPHRVWLRWQHLRPGEPAGLKIDGLVWLDDHWAWLPRPHEVLRSVVVSSPD